MAILGRDWHNDTWSGKDSEWFILKRCQKVISFDQYKCRCRPYYLYSGFFFPEIATKWLILFLGFGLLANGIMRIFTGLKKKEEESYNFPTVATGVLITSLSMLVLVYPKFGLALLLIMTAIALAISGIQIIIAGLRGIRRVAALYSEVHVSEVPSSKSSVPYEESSSLVRKGIWKGGSWFSGEAGRYVLFRGVNSGSRSKLPPYLPIAPLDIKDPSSSI